MNSFVQLLWETTPEENRLSIFWLGQAGFALKTNQGKTIIIDPYLSEYVMRSIPQEGLGFKRLMPTPCTPRELKADYILISHEHPDHFDVDSIREFMEASQVHVYTNAPVVAQMAEMGLDMTRVHCLQRNAPITLEGFELLPTDCDHGEMEPEALGFILDFGFISIYYSGDTSLSPERLQVAIAHKPEVAILPINGAYGNLDGLQAARYAAMLQCKICIPCHFWTFPMHHGDPQQIIDALPIEAPNCKLALLCQGESVIVPS